MFVDFKFDTMKTQIRASFKVSLCKIPFHSVLLLILVLLKLGVLKKFPLESVYEKHDYVIVVVVY